MANSSLLNATDDALNTFDESLFKVLKELDKRVLDILGAAKTGVNDYDAAMLLNSRAEMIIALRESGYNALVEDYVKTYEDTPELVKKAFKARDLPPPQFTTADATTFRQLATADLEAFSVIGNKAMDDLRLELYRNAVSGAPFSAMVEAVAAATVGFDAKGSPLSNYARTYANTAHLNFSGEVMRVAGESIGAEFWECVGPLDNVTRPECVAALADPIRTKDEWIAADYWGGTPGGWQCRHMVIVAIDDA